MTRPKSPPAVSNAAPSTCGYIQKYHCIHLQSGYSSLHQPCPDISIGGLYFSGIYRNTVSLSPASGNKRKFPLAAAVLCLYFREHHFLVFADFRWLAAKKALSSSRNSFFSFKTPDFFILLFLSVCTGLRILQQDSWPFEEYMRWSQYPAALPLLLFTSHKVCLPEFPIQQPL